MEKKLAILAASVLITLGYVSSASASETMSCTAKAGKAGGEAAQKCLKVMSDPKKHP